jgi:hypothetical protein
VNGQLHTPAALSPRKIPPCTHRIGHTVGPKSGLENAVRTFLTLLGLEYRPLRRPARIVTEPYHYLNAVLLTVPENSSPRSQKLYTGARSTFIRLARTSIDAVGTWATGTSRKAVQIVVSPGRNLNPGHLEHEAIHCCQNGQSCACEQAARKIQRGVEPRH